MIRYLMVTKKSNYLSVISLNVEFNRHINTVISFLQKQKVDVVLIQEILEQDLLLFSKMLRMHYIFTPLTKLKIDFNIYTLGLAVFTKLDIKQSKIEYYYGDLKKIPTITQDEPWKMLRALVIVKISKNGQTYDLINTHFTWTPDGKTSPQQINDLKNMLKILDKYKEFILCGDFNAPRGGMVFDELSKNYQDNIPKKIKSTLDPNLHRIKGLKLVVDGVFSKGLKVTNVQIKSSISDHCAILAKIKVHN